MNDIESKKLLEELLNKQKAGQLKPSDRYQIPPQPMPAQDPDVCRGNINEVAQGYTQTQAKLEALRCLQCKNAPCVEGCPVRIKIRDFIAAIAESKFDKALEIIKENSLLPAVCGRVAIVARPGHRQPRGAELAVDRP